MHLFAMQVMMIPVLLIMMWLVWKLHDTTLEDMRGTPWPPLPQNADGVTPPKKKENKAADTDDAGEGIDKSESIDGKGEARGMVSEGAAEELLGSMGMCGELSQWVPGGAAHGGPCNPNRIPEYKQELYQRTLEIGFTIVFMCALDSPTTASSLWRPKLHADQCCHAAVSVPAACACRRIYPVVSATIFSSFLCQTLDGEEDLMIADFQISCYTDDHYWLMVVSTVRPADTHAAVTSAAALATVVLLLIDCLWPH